MTELVTGPGGQEAPLPPVCVAGKEFRVQLSEKMDLEAVKNFLLPGSPQPPLVCSSLKPHPWNSSWSQMIYFCLQAGRAQPETHGPPPLRNGHQAAYQVFFLTTDSNTHGKSLDKFHCLHFITFPGLFTCSVVDCGPGQLSAWLVIGP